MMRCSDLYPSYTGATLVSAWTKSTVTIPGHSLQAGMVIDTTPSVQNSSSKRRAVITAVSGDTLSVEPMLAGAPESNITVQREWRRVAFQQGTVLPTVAAKWEWFWRTDTKEMYWATEPNEWTRIAPTYTGDESDVAALEVPSLEQSDTGSSGLRSPGFKSQVLCRTDGMFRVAWRTIKDCNVC